jgi:hypothetical protein
MTSKHNIGDLVKIYSPAFHGAMGIILRIRHSRQIPTANYEVKLILDHDFTVWYQEKMLREIK